MNTLKSVSKIDQLESAYFVGLMKQENIPVLFDFTPKTLKILNLRLEIHSKYASSDDGVHRFHFTSALITELKEVSRGAGFCVALFCEDSEQPCILDYLEWRQIANLCKGNRGVNIAISVKKNTFHLKVGDIKKNISKISCQRKLFAQIRGNG